MTVRLNQLTEVPPRVKVLFPPFSDQPSKVSLGAEDPFRNAKLSAEEVKSGRS
jgi:hypothetical protein